jgi:hypothetical protein
MAQQPGDTGGEAGSVAQEAGVALRLGPDGGGVMSGPVEPQPMVQGAPPLAGSG